MNEQKEIIEMLELLLERSNPASNLGFPATLIEDCSVDSFDFVINKAIIYIKEHRNGDTEDCFGPKGGC